MNNEGRAGVKADEKEKEIAARQGHDPCCLNIA